MPAVVSPPKKAPPFKMPHVDPGDVVVWLSDPDADPKTGYIVMVARNQGQCIDAVQLGGRARQLDALRHRNDPMLKENPELLRELGGCWVESTNMLRMNEIETLLSELAAEIGGLKAAIKRLLKE